MFSLVYTVYFQKQPPEYRCSVKKGLLKNFVNFIGKHLGWSPFLIKLQAWHLFWRKFANGCLCTKLTPLSVTCRFTLYSAPSSSSSLLILFISSMFVFGSNSKDFKEFKFAISFHWSHFHQRCFLFPCFFCLSQFCFIFSCRCLWELIKSFCLHWRH